MGSIDNSKDIDPWVLEFVVSNTIIDNNQWKNCISLDFNVRGLNEPRNPRILDTINNDFTVFNDYLLLSYRLFYIL